MVNPFCYHGKIRTMSETLLDLLDAAPSDRLAVVSPAAGIELSYGALRQQVRTVAAIFAEAGIRRGDRVALALPNGSRAVVSFLAAAAAGTAAPLNLAYRVEEFRFYLEDTAARLLVVPAEGAEAARQAAGDRVPILTAEEILAAAPRTSAPADPAPSPGDVALVLHTSGSTGRPKRVPLTHFNLVASAQNTVNTYQLGPQDTTLCVMPLFHVHGLVASLLATLLSGGTVVVPPRFSPLSFWPAARQHRVTWFSAVPTIHQLLLARLGGEKPAGAERLRFIRSCSAALPVQTGERLEAALGVPVLEAYGMTEASHQMSSNPLPPDRRKLGSVGTATGVRIAILDSRGLAGPGQTGEVVIQGPNVIRGYENEPQADAGSFLNGWFRTGDQGVLDADGYLRLTGRLKELINRGGEKISPPEIDEVLLAHPAVADAVCFGVAHPTWGEEVAAAVVLREAAGEADLVAHCRERLADFKCPKKIHLLDSIPRTVTGKIQRRAVAELVSGNRP